MLIRKGQRGLTRAHPLKPNHPDKPYKATAPSRIVLLNVAGRNDITPQVSVHGKKTYVALAPRLLRGS
jgi:hypothetical protein